MYEFSYVNAANSSLKEIIDARENLLNLLRGEMGEFNPDDPAIEEAFKRQMQGDYEEEEELNDGTRGVIEEIYDEENDLNNLEEKTILEQLNKMKEEKGEDFDNIPELSEDEFVKEDLDKEKVKEIQVQVQNMSPYEMGRLQIYIDLYYYTKYGFNVVIEVDKMKNEEIKLKHIESLIKKAKALNLPLNLFVSGYSKIGNEKEHVDMLFTQNILNTFIALNNYLRANKMGELRFMEDPLHPDSSWTLSQVINANEEINSLVDTIKMQNFTPYEAMAYIHFYLSSQFPYKENVEDPLAPRSIVGLLNSEDIVCVGYAKFIKAVVDKLNMPGLSAQTIESVLKPVQPKNGAKMVNKYPISGFAHLQNLITINDPKYGVKGTYMNDACWDAKNDSFPSGKGFGNFMYSINDAFKYNSFTYQEIPSQNAYDATKILQSQKIMRKEEMPFYQKYSKQSKTIPIETFENCLYNMFKKSYPSLDRKQLKDTITYYTTLSKVIAASIFSEQAENKLAVEGREIQKTAQQKINDREIIK